MIKWIGNFFVQIYLRTHVRKQKSISLLLFDYNNGKYDVLLNDWATERNEGLMHIFVDQMMHHGKDQTLIAVIHAENETGFVLGVTNHRQDISRFFKKDMYEMADAFTEVALWCRKVNHGKNQGQQATSQNTTQES